MLILFIVMAPFVSDLGVMMSIFKKSLIAFAIAGSIVSMNSIANTVSTQVSVQSLSGQSSSLQQSIPTSAPQLITANWDVFNQQQLNKLIADYGKTSANYNPEVRPYAVFDWDNTSVFLDIQEALLIYQIEHLIYKMTPEQFDSAIRMNVPQDNFVASLNNQAGQPVNIDLIAQDIIANYRWIYQNFDQMQGDKPLAEIKQSDQYKEFASKLRYLYSAIGDTFDVSIAYPWVTYLFSGMTEKDIRTMTSATVKWQLNQPIESVKWHSPAIDSKAGQVVISWNNGLRLVPEMQDLYHKLREAGIDVWICSASFIDVIKEISSNPEFGYNNPEDHVIAMELERDSNGIILQKYRQGYSQTQGPGKTIEINRLIAPRYDQHGPILVAGDSEGDQNMFQDFTDTKLVLIINRLKGSDIGKLSKIAVDTYQQADAKYLLQGRDENTGLFLPGQKTIKLGKKEPQLLK